MEDRGLDPPGGRDLELVRYRTDLLEDFKGTESSITHLLGWAVNPQVGSFEVNLVANLVVRVVLSLSVMPTLHVVLRFSDGCLRIFVRPLQVVKEALGFKVLGSSGRGCARVRVSTCLEEERGVSGGGRDTIVVAEFLYRQPVCPVRLPIIDVYPNERLDFLVESLRLSICLGMTC